MFNMQGGFQCHEELDEWGSREHRAQILKGLTEPNVTARKASLNLYFHHNRCFLPPRTSKTKIFRPTPDI